MIQPKSPGNDRISDMSRHGTLASVCALLVWIGGCPKRQQPNGIVVYVPAPAPAAAPATSELEVLVIEEPAPQPKEVKETPPPEVQEPPKNTTSGRRTHAARTTPPPEPDETFTPDNLAAPPAEVPALEPRQSSAQETDLKRRYQDMEQDIRQRLAHFNGVRLSTNDQRTLEDARTHYAQATQAMANGDLPRALNLARKASLLLAALE